MATTLTGKERARLGFLKAGQIILVLFLVTSVLLTVFLGSRMIHAGWTNFWHRYLAGTLILLLIEAILFWIGIIMVYCTSVQLGIRERVIGILVGWMPVIHLIALIHIIVVAGKECRTERKKDKLNVSRAAYKCCNTRYPILMVHGVFFRDFEYLNYWGRVPGELEKNGARIFYGNHQSAAAVPDSAAELAARIKQIVQETGCEKVNVIAHSKGGLDTRFAISCLDAAPYIASLTTINTPHRGCEFADFLMSKAGEGLKAKVAAAYNAGAHRLGDPNPDFIAAVTDLTSSRVYQLNQMMANFDFKANGIYTQSVGSRLKHMTSGRFPLNMSFHLVKHFDGPNDGLVGHHSFGFGEKFQFLEAPGNRGISHADMIDLNREDIPGFDIREFYVGLVAELKSRGL